MCGRNAVESGSEGERRVWIPFYAGRVIPTLLEKLWVLRSNYRQVQLETSVVYLSGYDHQEAACSNLKSRPHVMAQDIDFAVINIEKVTATKEGGIEWTVWGRSQGQHPSYGTLSWLLPVTSFFNLFVTSKSPTPLKLPISFPCLIQIQSSRIQTTLWLLS